MQKKKAAQKRRFFVNEQQGLLSYCLSRNLSLNGSLLCRSLSLFSYLFLNYYLYRSSSFSLSLCALFLAALVAAAHCSKCNSYDKKHLFHCQKCF